MFASPGRLIHAPDCNSPGQPFHLLRSMYQSKLLQSVAYHAIVASTNNTGEGMQIGQMEMVLCARVCSSTRSDWCFVRLSQHNWILGSSNTPRHPENPRYRQQQQERSNCSLLQQVHLNDWYRKQLDKISIARFMESIFGCCLLATANFI